MSLNKQRKQRTRKYKGELNAYSPEYHIHKALVRRCTDPNRKDYSYYGGRGITVCKRWLDFDNFAADMGPRPSINHSIDRIDNSKGYSPDNCKWVTREEQANNRRNNIYIPEIKMTLSEVCRQHNLPYNYFYRCIQRNKESFESTFIKFLNREFRRFKKEQSSSMREAA